MQIPSGLSVAIACIMSFLLSCNPPADLEKKETVWEEINKGLWKQHLDVWYPVAIDSASGGYLSNLDSGFKPMAEQSKMIVSQARHLWMTSLIAKQFNLPNYTGYANHGFPFVKQMWDSVYGGFYQQVNREGSVKDQEIAKTAYGNAFAIYGLSAYHALTKKPEALDLAKKTFHWLESGSWDKRYGGYFQDLDRMGKPIPRPADASTKSTIGFKDYNSSIHLLEAFTALYQEWPDSLLKQRLRDMFFIVKDTMMNEDGYLKMYFSADWIHRSFYGQDSSVIMSHASIDHVSFGHDIETAFLLWEAAEQLGYGDAPGFKEQLKGMMDHALLGFDTVRGGLYDEGYYFDRNKPIAIIKNSKTWWAQAEALNTLHLMNKLFPNADYEKLFLLQWKYIKQYIIDPVHGGWYTFGLDTRPEVKNWPKASVWKATYHDGRAMLSVLEREGIVSGKHH